MKYLIRFSTGFVFFGVLFLGFALLSLLNRTLFGSYGGLAYIVEVVFIGSYFLGLSFERKTGVK